MNVRKEIYNVGFNYSILDSMFCQRQISFIWMYRLEKELNIKTTLGPATREESDLEWLQ